MSALEELPTGDYERRVFKAFVVDGRLKAIPVKRKKCEVLLRYIVRCFEKERVYREAEVNALLRAFHEGVAFLRRELVDFGYLVRYRGEYARSEGLSETKPEDRGMGTPGPLDDEPAM